MLMGDIRSLEYMAHINPESLLKQDENGWKPIHLAAFVGHMDVVQLLLKHGASLTDKTTSGHNLLELAWESPYVGDDHELLRFLRAREIEL